MKRQRTYTKRQSSLTRGRVYLKRKWRAFQKMSRRKKIIVIATPIAALDSQSAHRHFKHYVK